MKKLLLEDLKRAFFSYPFLVAGCLCIGAGIYGFWPEWDLEDPLNGFAYLFRLAHSSGTTSILSLLAPLLVTLPFVSSYYMDKKSGFFTYILLRTQRKNYILSKLLSNGLVGGSVLSIPLLMLLAVLMILYPGSSRELVNPGGAFGGVYQQSEVGYLLVIIGISFLFGVTYATLGLGVSAFVNNPYFAMIVPFFVYLVPGFVFPYLSLAYLEPSTTFVIDSNTLSTPVTVFTQLFLLLAIGVISFILGVVKKSEEYV